MKVNALDLTPRPLATADEREGQIVLTRPRPNPSGLRAPLDWLIYLLAPKRLRLDDFGSFCWRHVDGRRDVWEIARLMREEFGERCEPAEERVGRFLTLLAREELVQLADQH